MKVEQLSLPPDYGTPTKLLEWTPIAERLAAARHYWLATTRPDGRPHVVPMDGLWLHDRWYFGGSDQAVKHRNLLANPMATLHLEDAAAAVIVEGCCQFVAVDGATAAELTEHSRTKYGYGPPPVVYEAGVWKLNPVRVLAWTALHEDATRFILDA